MRAVRIGEIAGDEDEVGLKLLEQLADDLDVGRTDRILAHLSGLVERQVEEAGRAARQADRLDAAHRFGFADDALDVLYFRNVDFAGGLRSRRCEPRGERVDLVGVTVPRRRALEEIDIATDVMVEDRDVAARHVRHDDVVVVLDELAENAAHRDDVVVGVRREADDLTL